ncbi:uncharacterized protein LOC126835841 [Adelges cooleyi]|uniref:uncharacterized protein LOC126835841 n=1 Tax=Adelges cooleyi TaxID=133065 RepID=UPI00217FE0E7|nr:uncharacterized protein LOC126835841 [Adelges cooleyi]
MEIHRASNHYDSNEMGPASEDPNQSGSVSEHSNQSRPDSEDSNQSDSSPEDPPQIFIDFDNANGSGPDFEYSNQSIPTPEIQIIVDYEDTNQNVTVSENPNQSVPVSEDPIQNMIKENAKIRYESQTGNAVPIYMSRTICLLIALWISSNTASKTPTKFDGDICIIGYKKYHFVKYRSIDGKLWQVNRLDVPIKELNVQLYEENFIYNILEEY